MPPSDRSGGLINALPPADVEDVLHEAEVLAARVQEEMLAEVSEEIDQRLRDAERARNLLLRHAADAHVAAALELERASKERDTAVAVRQEAEDGAEAVARAAEQGFQASRTAAEAEAAATRSRVEAEVRAAQQEVERIREETLHRAAERRHEILLEAEAEGQALLAEATSRCETALEEGRVQLQVERELAAEETAARVERVLAEAFAAADQHRAEGERDAAASLQVARASVDQLQLEVIEEGRQEVAGLLAEADVAKERILREAEEQARRVMAHAESVAMVLRAEAAEDYARQRAAEDPQALLPPPAAPAVTAAPTPSPLEVLTDALEPRAPEPAPEPPTLAAGQDARARLDRLRSTAIGLLVFLLPALLLVLAFKGFVGQAYSIPSRSMEPQLAPGDRVAVSRLSYRLHEPRRGDILVFDSPIPDGGGSVFDIPRTLLEAAGLLQPDDDTYIKRVIALPGEMVEGRDGKVFIDGRELIEPYLEDGTVTSEFETQVIDEDELWVMGDRRDQSLDSRIFGPIDVDSIEGRAVLRVWPPQRAAFL